MATKTNNLGLSKAELTDSIRNTLLANNQNFDKLDEADTKTNDRISILRENQISENVTGTELEINSDIETESILYLSGNSEQDTRSGKNLFNYKDTENVSNEVTVDDEGWITITYDNSKSSVYKNVICLTNPMDLLPSTNYVVFTEIKNVTGSGKLYSVSAGGTNDPSQFAVAITYELSALSNGNIKRDVVKTKADLSNINIGARTLLNLEAGQSGSITFRLSVLEDTTVTTDTFEYEAYGLQPSPEFESPIRSIKSKSDNLLPNTGATKTLYGITFTVNEDKTVTVNGTATAKTTIMLYEGEITFPAGTYTLSISKNGTKDVYVGMKLGDKFYQTQTSKTITLTETTICYKWYIDIYSGVTVKNLVLKPMFNKGDKALPYVPYNTYVPVEVKAEGKNLLNLHDTAPATINKIPYSVSDQKLILNGTGASGSYPWIIITKNKVYGWNGTPTAESITSNADGIISTGIVSKSMKVFSGSATYDIGIYLYDENGKDITNKLTENTNIVSVGLYLGNGKTYTNYTIGIQLEKGETVTKYEPCKTKTISLPLGDIELCSTPDGTRDTFERVDGVWNYVEKAPSVILDGSDDEGWLINHLLDKTVRVDATVLTNGKPISKNKCLCSRFTMAYGDTSDYEHARNGDWKYSTTFVFYINKDRIGNPTTKEEALTGVKTWLANNPMEVIYPLETPTYTPITDTALIQALDELEQLILHKGYNRITATAVNEVKAKLDLTYYKSTEKEIERIETKFDKETDNLKKEADNLKEENLKLNDKVDRLYANQIQGTASGTEIVIQDGAKMESILHLNGNSEQDSRSGYNLFNYKTSIYTSINGLTNVINNDGTITTTGTPTTGYVAITQDIYITNILEDGQIYTLGQTVASDNSAYIQINAVKADGSGTTYINPSITRKTIKFTVDKTTYSKYIIKIQTGALSSMPTPINFTAGYMLLKGSYTDDTLPKFEQYGAQPSLDYPSEIRSVKSKSDNLVKLYTNTGSVTSAGVTVTMIDYNTVKINGTATANGWLELLYAFKNGTDAKTDVAIPLDNIKYTASCFVESGSLSSTDNAGYITFAMTDGSAETQNAVNFGKSKTFDGLKGIGRIFLGVKSGITYNNFVVKVQLNKGTVALPYQPYGYAPVEVKVEGKNLLKKTNSYVTTTTNGITYTVNKDQSVTINGTNNGTAHANLYLLNKDSEPLIIPAGTYKVGRTGHNGVQVLYYDGSKFGVLQSNTKDTITFASDTTFTQVYVTIEKTVTDTFNNVTVYPIMVRDTDSLEPYEPHKLTTISLPLGDIELRSTPDGTRDTFERVDGVWNKVSKNSYTVFNGNEVWKLQSINSYGIANFLCDHKLNSIADYGTSRRFISTHFKSTNVVIANAQNEGAFWQGNAVYLRLKSTTASTADEFKQWLSTNNVGCLYQLATPTYTPITDQTLISALDELEELILHKGYNRITATAVNGVKAYLDLSYIKDINIVLENLISRIGGAE